MSTPAPQAPADNDRALLPPGLADAVEQETGLSILTVRPRGGGGASREGAELALARPGGDTLHAYMNYDVHKAGAGDDDAFLREAAILRALSGPLAESGVRVAPFIGAVPNLRALVTGLVAGESDFNKAGNAGESIACDFVGQIAALHAIAPDAVAALRRPASLAALVADRLENLDERIAQQPDDALLRLARRWLGDHVPPEPERLTIVHGDAGPANFLYANGRVTAMLDWELVHVGDPMADFAMMALRMLFQPFAPMPKLLAAYSAAGGQPVDLARISYWRILFQAGFTSMSRYDDPTAPPPPNLGMNMVYTQVHRRVLAQALAEASGIVLPVPSLPGPAQGAHARSFDLAAHDLRAIIVPRITDQQAAAKAKGLARLIKYWRNLDRFGAAFEAAEIAETAAALGGDFATARNARMVLGAAIEAGTVDLPTALRLCHAREERATRLLADSMGKFVDARFAPLS